MQKVKRSWCLSPVLQIVYYDGQFDDARLNVTLACTAAANGAAVVNHAKANTLLKVCLSSILRTHRPPCTRPLCSHKV